MSEFGIGTLASLSLVGLATGCFLYMRGGRRQKYMRRFVGSLVIAGTSITMSVLMKRFSPWLFLSYPVIAGGMTLGYGANELFPKILKRSLFAAGVVSAGLVYCFVFGGNAWWVLLPHVGVAAWSICLGVKNPLHAAAEECFICALLNLGLMMYPFVT